MYNKPWISEANENAGKEGNVTCWPMKDEKNVLEWC